MWYEIYSFFFYIDKRNLLSEKIMGRSPEERETTPGSKWLNMKYTFLRASNGFYPCQADVVLTWHWHVLTTATTFFIKKNISCSWTRLYLLLWEIVSYLVMDDSTFCGNRWFSVLKRGFLHQKMKTNYTDMSHDRATSKATLLSYGGSPWDPCRNSTIDMVLMD